MEWLTKELVTAWGPLALGWVAAGYLLYQLMNLNKAFTRQVDRNIEALTELTTLFKERLPRRGRDE